MKMKNTPAELHALKALRVKNPVAIPINSGTPIQHPYIYNKKTCRCSTPSCPGHIHICCCGAYIFDQTDWELLK